MIRMLPKTRGRSTLLHITVAVLLTLALLASLSQSLASTEPNGPVWNPVASERLIKLPGSYLKKAVENDFASSRLAASMRDTENHKDLKTQTLTDLQLAIDAAEGDLKTELRHQFLAEKRDYLELVGRHQDLRRQQATTKMRLYERLLNKLGQKEAAMTPERQALVERQEDASRRLERSISKVDLKLFSTPMTGQSKYAREHAKNVVAIERLLAAIKSHPMSADSQINGRPVTKQAYLRQLVGETQSEIAIIDQEESILGYMAKLVSLDAMALSDLLTGGSEAEPEGEAEAVGITAAVEFFVP